MSRNKKSARMTPGERIAAVAEAALISDTNSTERVGSDVVWVRTLARRIDAAIKRAVNAERKRCADAVSSERSRFSGACDERALLNRIMGEIMYTTRTKP